MISLRFSTSEERPLRILCLGAHSDDIEIGCGGTLIQLFAKRPLVEVFWVVLSADPERDREAEKSAGIYLEGVARKEIEIKSFRDSYFPYIGGTIKEYLQSLSRRFRPDVVFAPTRHDLHQDHRLVSELTWNIFRDQLILEYEILKYDGDLGTPNLFVPLEHSVCEEKIRRLMTCFKTQQANSWFNEDCFYGLMRIRGVEANSPTKYAEAFYCRKIALDLSSLFKF
jgi:LmbE family N-acetylglucosaminyl deacetylase